MLLSIAFSLINSYNPNLLLLDRIDQNVYRDGYSGSIFTTSDCSDRGDQLAAMLFNGQILRFVDSGNNCVVVKIKSR
jgi:hypothetical protein